MPLFTLVGPEVPWFGFSKEAGENIRATNLLVAIWFAAFSLPMFFWVKEDCSQVSAPGQILAQTRRQLATTFKEIRDYKQIVRFLLARLLYNDGLVTVFAFGGIYAAGTFGFDMEDMLIFGIVLNVTAGLGAFCLGFLDDLLGGKKTLQISVIGLIVATIVAVWAPTRAWFWVAGILLGIFAGPNQSASRSLMGRFVPPDKENEFFGFFAFSGKFTAFLGPFLLGCLDAGLQQSAGWDRRGPGAVRAGPGCCLASVDEEEGVAAAGRGEV